MLTDLQIERYARHVLLREVGGAGQERLLAARVAVAGLGPAGAWAAAYLALAGVGRLELADEGPVTAADLTPLLAPGDLGARRDEAVARALPAWNPDVAASTLVTQDVAGVAAGAGPRPVAQVLGAGETAPAAGPKPVSGVAGAAAPAAVIVTDPGVPFPVLPGVPAVLALAAGERALVGPLAPGGPCASCAAAFLGPADPAPAAATLAGSLAATRVLARIAAGAPPAGWFLLGPDGLRSLDPRTVPCAHRTDP